MAWRSVPNSNVTAVGHMPHKSIESKHENFLAHSELYMYENTLFGTLDFSSLPEPSEEILLHTNAFVGSIYLTALPPKLQTLDISRNDIRQKLVPYGSLPSGLQPVDLYQNHGPLTVFSVDESYQLDPTRIRGVFYRSRVKEMKSK